MDFFGVMGLTGHVIRISNFEIAQNQVVITPHKARYDNFLYFQNEADIGAKKDNPWAWLRKLIQKWSVTPQKSKVPAKGLDPASQTLLKYKKNQIMCTAKRQAWLKIWFIGLAYFVVTDNAW